MGFRTDPSPEIVLNRILENARHVPSAGFTQDYDLVVVRDSEKKRSLAKAAHEQD